MKTSTGFKKILSYETLGGGGIMVVGELLFRGTLYLTWSQVSSSWLFECMHVHYRPKCAYLSDAKSVQLFMFNICLRYCRYGVKHRSIDQSMNPSINLPAVGNHGDELSGMINKFNLHRLILQLPYIRAYHFQSNLKYLQGYRISQLIKQSPFFKS